MLLGFVARDYFTIFPSAADVDHLHFRETELRPARFRLRRDGKADGGGGIGRIDRNGQQFVPAGSKGC